MMLSPLKQGRDEMNYYTLQRITLSIKYELATWIKSMDTLRQVTNNPYLKN